jgi:CRP-like cAMP-binding protein
MIDRVVKLLDVDPELGEQLSPERLPVASRVVRAARVPFSGDERSEEDWPEDLRRGLGLLVLDGLLTRRVELGGRYAAELLGPGDLLRPWQADDQAASVNRSSGWRCLSECSVAVLDLDFAKRISAFPEVQAQLIARTLRRSRHLAITIAILNQAKIDRRLLMLLWHMADRWGFRRQGEVVLPYHLPHAVLAEVIIARRPTVTTALGALQASGQIRQTAEGWLLYPPPPGEFTQMAQPGDSVAEVS